MLAALYLIGPRTADGQAREVTLEELTQASTDVVWGAVSDKRSFWDEGGKRIFTEVRVQVAERLKGEGAEETIILIPGGQVGNTLYDVSDMPVFIDGEEVLVFLWQNPAGKHLVTGAAQGKLRVEKDAGGGRMMEPGAARLMDTAPEEEGAPAKASIEASRRIPLDALVRAVKNVGRK